MKDLKFFMYSLFLSNFLFFMGNEKDQNNIKA